MKSHNATIHQRAPRLRPSQLESRQELMNHVRTLVRGRNAMQNMISKTRPGIAVDNLHARVQALNRTLGELQSAIPTTLRRPKQ